MKRNTARSLALTLTLVRVPLGVVFLLWLYFEGAQTHLWGLIALLGLIELTDLLDGSIARRNNAVTELGATLDPWADSTTRTIIYISLAIAGRTSLALPLIMAMRDVTVAYTRIVFVGHKGTAAARISGKVKAWVQGVGAFVLLCGPLFGAGKDYYVLTGWIVGVVTVVSASEYIFSALRILIVDDTNGESKNPE